MPAIDDRPERTPSFRTLFGRSPTVTAFAHGRVNLIGEHTDYNGGFVLPTPIPQRTRVELAPRVDRSVRAWSADAASDVVEYRLGGESPRQDWLDYLQGVTHVLLATRHELGGFDARIESEVPLGAGLASSAALEVSLARALRDAFGLPLDDLALALVGQRAENEFVGARVGVMDQMAASLAAVGLALFVDTRSLDYRPVPFPAGAELVVLSSGLAHQHAAGDYNARRAECEHACALLGVAQLRDIGVDELGWVESLPEPLGRRARHVITENARVLAAVEAMQVGNLTRLGDLFFASHASQRDDYEVSIPEIDLLVELARAQPDVLGARLTGGGFGGSVVLLVRAGSSRPVATRVAAAYGARAGHAAGVLVPAPA